MLDLALSELVPVREIQLIRRTYCSRQRDDAFIIKLQSHENTTLTNVSTDHL